MTYLIVTRHPALVDLLRERFPDLGEVTVLTHVEDPEVLRGKVVFGVLPLHLASLCREVVEVPLALTPEDRGVELSLDRLREVAGPTRRFVVLDEAAVERCREFHEQAENAENARLQAPFEAMRAPSEAWLARHARERELEAELAPRIQALVDEGVSRSFAQAMAKREHTEGLLARVVENLRRHPSAAARAIRSASYLRFRTFETHPGCGPYVGDVCRDPEGLGLPSEVPEAWVCFRRGILDDPSAEGGSIAEVRLVKVGWRLFQAMELLKSGG